MVRKTGQIIRRGSSTWLVRIYVSEQLSEQAVLRPGETNTFEKSTKRP